jgi:hypothetical protein
MPGGPVRPVRRPKETSRVVSALFLLGFLTAGQTVTVLFTWGWPDSLAQWAVLTGILVAGDVTVLGVQALWERATRKRRQYRNTG